MQVWKLGYGLDGRGIEIQFPVRVRDFSLLLASNPAPGPNQSPIQWGPGGSFLGSKAAGM
jgi:hypothetical protein